MSFESFHCFLFIPLGIEGKIRFEFDIVVGSVVVAAIVCLPIAAHLAVLVLFWRLLLRHHGACGCFVCCLIDDFRGW